MALPSSYSELYPGRFLKADMLKGRKVTLTIKDIEIEELVGEKNKKEPKVIVKFAERPLELVFPKTNGYCMKRMFGNDPHAWIGKRITIYPTETSFGRETVECIRVWGSPELTEDMPITVPQGRKKALEMVMHAVRGKEQPKPEPVAPKHDWSAEADALFTKLNVEADVRQKLFEQCGADDAELIAYLQSTASEAQEDPIPF